MDYRITQCPRCGTSFRVTDAHLAIAAGAVRCGSCLHIFNAREHWVEEQSAEDEAQEQVLREDEALEQAALAAMNDVATTSDHDAEERFGDENDDDLLFGDDPSDREPSFFTSDDDRLLFLDTSVEQTRLAPDDGALAPDFLETAGWTPEPQNRFEEDRVDDETGTDDSWAEQLLVDDNPSPEPAQRLDSDADPLLDEFDDILASTPIADDSGNARHNHRYDSQYDNHYDDGRLGANHHADERRDDDHPDDWHLGDEDYGIRPAPADPELQLSTEFLSINELGRSASRESTGIADGGNLSEEWQRVLGGDAGEVSALRADERIGDDGGTRGRHLLGSFEPEPLQLHRFVHEPRWPKLLWGLGLVAGIALLVGQYIHFNFPTLARGEQRPLMAQLCAVVGCTLPPHHELAAIRTSSLIVRSHPSRPGALAIDAILTNTATFRQPYPNLLLQFTDLNGDAVAGGIFTPADYLGGEQAGAALMPMQQPVHIGLTIADPGNRAVNYQLFVAPPDAR